MSLLRETRGIAQDAGWSDDSLLMLVCRFIEIKGDPSE